MLTARGWWFLVSVLALLLLGLLRHTVMLILPSLTLLLWFSWEWLLFALRRNRVAERFRLGREISDERGPVTALWAGQAFQVGVRLHGSGRGLPPYLVATDLVPFDVIFLDGTTRVEGEPRPGGFLEMTYRFSCGQAGAARFEGVRVRLADLQGFFHHAFFLCDPVVLPILPALQARTVTPLVKRTNQLLPPGIHRLHRPGSGSELLDLRDYQPGDPPRTIAWKISARRDRLITKEFESEVPIRCTLFIDASNSVRLPSPQGTALGRLIDLAAVVLQTSTRARDLTGLCLFDEGNATFVRPDRSGSHLTQMLHLLAEAAAQSAHVSQAAPDDLLPLAYSFAREVYPGLLNPRINSMPFWQQWIETFPGVSPRRPGWRERLHRFKPRLFHAGTWGVPLLIALGNGLLLLNSAMGLGTRLVVLLLSSALAWLSFTGTLMATSGILLITRPQRRQARWRKRLAALLSVRYGLAPGGLSLLLEDDDALSRLLQRFLAEHRVPYSLPLYDAAGRYLFAAPDKVAVLARALLQAVARGHDNELFVLLVDLLELDDRLEPLLRAVAVALGRHHQVLLVCPWLPSVPFNAERGARDAERQEDRPRTLQDRLEAVTRQRFQEAYQRVRRAFGRLGVTVVCAAGVEPIPLIQARMDRLRTQRRTR